MLKGYVKRGSNTLYGPYIEVYVEGFRPFYYCGRFRSFRRAIAYYRKIRNLKGKHINFYTMQ